MNGQDVEWEKAKTTAAKAGLTLIGKELHGRLKEKEEADVTYTLLTNKFNQA